MKQEAVSLFRVPDADVFALHLLLRFGQSLSQNRHWPEVASNSKKPPVRPKPANPVAHRDVSVVAGWMIDLPPARQRRRRGGAKHVFDLLAAVGADGGDPTTADPVTADLTRQLCFRECRVENDAVQVHYKRNVGCGSDQRSSVFGIQMRQRLVRVCKSSQ